MEGDAGHSDSIRCLAADPEVPTERTDAFQQRDIEADLPEHPNVER